MKATILLNGECPSVETLKSTILESSILICADGATNNLVNTDIVPDVIIGDLDSLSQAARDKFTTSKIILKPSQYATDLEKALDYALEAGCQDIFILGSNGKRLDHALTNLSILFKNQNRASFLLIDDFGVGKIFSNKHDVLKTISFKTEIGTAVSIVSLPSIKNVTTKGLLYPINNETLSWAINTEGQSNEATETDVTITFGRGELLIYKKCDSHHFPT